jgi:hypothetical protein
LIRTAGTELSHVDPDFLKIAAIPTQATADMDDPRQFAAWALGSFPAPNKQMGDVPLTPPVPADFSERLSQLGFRHHPELQTKWLIAGDHPEAGYLNVPKIVDRAEYEAHLAAHADPEAEAENWRATAEAVLGKLDPKLLHRITAMTDEQKAAAAQVQREHIPKAFERLAQLREEIENPDS